MRSWILLATLFLRLCLPASADLSSLSRENQQNSSSKLKEMQSRLKELQQRRRERESGLKAPKAASGSIQEIDEKTKAQRLRQPHAEEPPFEFRTLQQLQSSQKSQLNTDWFEQLPLYGKHLFKRASKLQSLPENVPDEYILGPGDQLSIHIWNQTQDQAFLAEVGPSGMAPFPLAGEISLQGVSIGELPKYLQRKLNSYYKNLNVSARMTNLRQFPVYLTGEVKNPGLHLVNALTTPLQLLLLNGGPTSQASLRRIQLKRGSRNLQTVDLYAFLLQGDISGLRYMQPNDVLHIPLARMRVAIAGRVKRPAVYELLEGTTVREAVQLAGGLEADANRSLFQLIRYNGEGQAVVSDLTAWEQKRKILKDGEILRIHPMQASMQNTVRISGNVYAPGIYEWEKGMSLQELLKKAQGLRPQTYRNVVEIVRELPLPQNVPTQGGIDLKSQYETLNVSLSVEPGTQVRTALKPQDRVRVYHLNEVQASPTVEVSGEVQNPGSFELRRDMRVRDILLKAQLKDSAHLLSGEIARQSEQGIDIIKFNVKHAMEGEPSANIGLQNLDSVSIHQDPRVANQGSILLSGEVRFPGTYVFKSGDRLADILRRAGGISAQGWIRGARLLRKSLQKRQLKLRDQFVERERESVQNLKIQATQKGGEDASDRARDLQAIETVDKTLDKLARVEVQGRLSLNFRGMQDVQDIADSDTNVVLEDGDRFHVPTTPSDVTIAGQVYSPATVLHRPDFSVRDYIDLAGGYADNAHISRIYIVKSDGSAVPVRNKRRQKSRRYVSGVEDPISESLSRVSMVEPGDTIIVPLKIQLPRNRFRESLDSIYKMAITVGALGNVF